MASFKAQFTIPDDPGSYCFGSIRDGVFDGQIVTDSGTYYVERSNKHFHGDLQNLNKVYSHSGSSHAHSVIYHEKHIRYPLNHQRNGKCEISN